MSEEGNAGPIGGGQQGSGGTQEGAPPSGGSSDSGSPSVMSREALLQGLPEELRGETVFQNLNEENALPDLAKQFVNAQKMIGQERLPAPQENWGDEQWNRFWDKIGRPETPDQYVMPEVEGIQWDEEKTKGFKEFAHKLGIPDKQFGPLMQRYAGEMQEAMEAQQTQLKETVDKQLTALRADLAKEGREFDSVIELANEALLSFEDESLVQLFQENPILANHPSIVKTFASLAEAKRESLARNAGSGKINSPMDARAALQAFEQKHAELIYAEPESLSWNQREQRDRILKDRNDLYMKAYPEEKS